MQGFVLRAKAWAQLLEPSPSPSPLLMLTRESSECILDWAGVRSLMCAGFILRALSSPSPEYPLVHFLALLKSDLSHFSLIAYAFGVTVRNQLPYCRSGRCSPSVSCGGLEF